METRYDLKIYGDFDGVFESLMRPVSKDVKKKIVAEFGKRGIAKKWYGSFYKMASFFEVVYSPCCCNYNEERDCFVDDFGNECECDHFYVKVKDDYIPLSKWDSYIHCHFSDELVLLYSDERGCGYPTFEELLTFDIDGVKFRMHYCDGFSFYAYTEENDNRLYSISFTSGYFENDPDFLKSQWEASA